MDFSAISAELESEESIAVANQLLDLENLIYKLAKTHGPEILADPETRQYYVSIAHSLGIDPFKLNLHDPNEQELQNRVSVLLIEVSTQLQSSNGGITPLTDLCGIISSKLNTKVTSSDIKKSVTDLKQLGANYTIEKLKNGTKVLKSTSDELRTDHNDVFGELELTKFVTVDLLRTKLKWSESHCRNVLDDMLSLGFLWLDELPTGDQQFWNPISVD